MMPETEKVTPEGAPGPESSTATSTATSTESLPEDAPSYRGLKAVVIGLGLGIVAMLGLIFYTIGERAAESMLAEEAQAPVPAAPVVEAVSGAEAFNVIPPVGGKLISASLSGDEVLMQFETATGDVLIILNRRTGQQTRVTFSQ